MTLVLMNRVVARVAIGLDEALVAREQLGRMLFAATRSQVEDRVRELHIAEDKPGVGGAFWAEQ